MPIYFSDSGLRSVWLVHDTTLSVKRRQGGDALIANVFASRVVAGLVTLLALGPFGPLADSGFDRPTGMSATLAWGADSGRLPERRWLPGQ